MKEKAELRRLLKERLSRLPEPARAQGGAQLGRKLEQRVHGNDCRRIGVFRPLPDEPDARPALLRLHAEGVELAMPFADADGVWRFHRLDDPERTLHEAFRLNQTATGPVVPVEDLDLILVPGLGFTPQGDRLGRGAGIYDRLLANATSPCIGAAFDCQRMDSLPTEPHDRRLEEVWFAES